MELQLGLSLPCNNPIKNFDLNTHGNDHQPKDLFWSFPINEQKKKKRSFDDAFVMHDVNVPQTLPLLVWHSNQEDDVNEASSIITNKNDGEENAVIGWPPVRYWRKKLCHQKHDGGGGIKSVYVKVKMEGVGIERKVDLSQHGSYQTLIHTLVSMFGHENVKLTYQDKEGDWLLAGDVPWGTFIETAHRLKLLRNGCD